MQLDEPNPGLSSDSSWPNRRALNSGGKPIMRPWLQFCRGKPDSSAGRCPRGRRRELWFESKGPAGGGGSGLTGIGILAAVLGIIAFAPWFVLRGYADPEPAPAVPLPLTTLPAATSSPIDSTVTPPHTPPIAQTILRFHGSNTIGGKLLPTLATAFLQQEGYTNIRKVPGANEEESFIAGDKNGRTEQIEIKAHGSGTAFKSLKEGLCDIGMSSRKIKPAEQQELMPVLGDVASNAGEHVVALDGIAIIVNPANPVKTLTLSQLADIFSGTIFDWSLVGGRPGFIKIYARDDKSGTYDFFNEAVLKTRGKSLVGDVNRFEDSQILSDSVARDPAGIGFVGLNYIGSNKVVALSDSDVEPRKPSLLTVKTEDYTLSRRLFLYTAVNPTNPNVKPFVQFALGTAAQPTVERADLVNMDLTPVPSDPNDPRKQFASWSQLTAGATEIPTRFRFRTGSSDVDTRANRDIGRIVGILSQPQYRGKQVILIGFADSSGSSLANKTLSQTRADIVKKELVLEGLSFSTVVGLGAQAFIASNATTEGREKNRRVEVWVK